MFTSQTGCLSNFVETDGCARTVIVLLLLTTVGCMSYTWGYYEGISNSQANLMLDKLHEIQLAQMAAKSANDTGKRHGGHGGHGMHLAEAAVDFDPIRSDPDPMLPKATTTSTVTEAAALEAAAASAEAKAILEDVAMEETGPEAAIEDQAPLDDEDTGAFTDTTNTASALRGSASLGGRKQKAGRRGDENR